MTDYTKLIQDAQNAGLTEADITFDDIEEFEIRGSVARYSTKVWQHRNAAEPIADGWECTRVMACVAENAPDDNWTPATLTALNNLTRLHVTAGVAYYGKL